jgi:hypothetical protein
MAKGCAFFTIMLRRATCDANGFNDGGSGSLARARR